MMPKILAPAIMIAGLAAGFYAGLNVVNRRTPQPAYRPAPQEALAEVYDVEPEPIIDRPLTPEELAAVLPDNHIAPTYW